MTLLMYSRTVGTVSWLLCVLFGTASQCNYSVEHSYNAQLI